MSGQSTASRLSTAEYTSVSFSATGSDSLSSLSTTGTTTETVRPDATVFALSTTGIVTETVRPDATVFAPETVTMTTLSTTTVAAKTSSRSTITATASTHVTAEPPDVTLGSGEFRGMLTYMLQRYVIMVSPVGEKAVPYKSKAKGESDHDDYTVTIKNDEAVESKRRFEFYSPGKDDDFGPTVEGSQLKHSMTCDITFKPGKDDNRLYLKFFAETEGEWYSSGPPADTLEMTCTDG